MATGWPLEIRQTLIQDLFLMVGDKQEIHYRDTPKSDIFWLVRAIFKDTTYSISKQSTLVRALKKTPIWPRISQFLTNSDSSCARKHCRGSLTDHGKTGNSKCIGTWCGSWALKQKGFKCSCPSYVQKPL